MLQNLSPEKVNIQLSKIFSLEEQLLKKSTFNMEYTHREQIYERCSLTPNKTKALLKKKTEKHIIKLLKNISKSRCKSLNQEIISKCGFAKTWCF